MGESNTRKTARVALSRKHVNSKHVDQLFNLQNMCKNQRNNPSKSVYCQIMTDSDYRFGKFGFITVLKYRFGYRLMGIGL